MSIQPYTFRLAHKADEAAVIDFMNTHWGSPHPLVNLPDFFSYYYREENGALRFALAETEGKIAALAGFIPSNRQAQPDIWVSIWVADKAAKGSGLELMAALPQLTGCRTLSCNNIRPKTRAFYEFLGYTTGRLHHFYRLAEKPQYTLAKISHKDIPPVCGKAVLAPLANAEALLQSGFVPPPQNPYKDIWYIARRYFAFPRQKYDVWGVVLPGNGTPQALLVTRTVPACGTNVLRIVDFIGPAALLPSMGQAIDTLIKTQKAEYADLYCTGLSPQLLYSAGFCARAEEDENIIPNYLTPPLIENTEYYYFTSRPDNFLMFKADGDQDRPNIPAE